MPEPIDRKESTENSSEGPHEEGDSTASSNESADPGTQNLEEVAFSLEWKSMTVMPTETADPLDIVKEIGGMPSPAAEAEPNDVGQSPEPGESSSGAGESGSPEDAG